MDRKFLKLKWTLGLAIAPTLLSLWGCGEPRSAPPERDLYCPPAQSAKKYVETPYVGSDSEPLSFQNIRANVNSACASCHMAPANNGGFTYIDSFQGKEMVLNGVTAWYDGFAETALKMRDALREADPIKRMPPEARRKRNPAAFEKMANDLDAWLAAGKPNGSFEAGGAPPPPVQGKPRPVKPHPTTELGDCVPVAKLIGFDYEKDREFASMTDLPKFLHKTDMHTLDVYELARKGTLAYSVEYPLWADNAEKGRFIHVPMKMESGRLTKQKIEYDVSTKQFLIPENTRFYKSFYRAVTLPNQQIKMRRMETRIIVSREPWQNSLFGTYQWDESEQVATLVETTYRDGTAWKDLVQDVIVDEARGKLRPYAIPGRQRCIDCHMGSPTQNFVLGFQPLQINRRPFGAAGRDEPVYPHDLDQVQRFVEYGLIGGIKAASELPVLEHAGTLPARNDHELRANGYAVGNCYHCHNPKGLAFTKENGIQLLLGPGDMFSFNTQQRSVQMASRRLVHQNGELDGSHIWRKVSDSPTQLGMFSPMPMHTPGAPDCRVMTVMGKWIRSFESNQAADLWAPACKKENGFWWIDMDFTWVESENYVPRRDDWKSSEGMPPRYRDLELSPSLKETIQRPYAVGYWVRKPQCKFPEVDLPPEERRPWMMIGDKPKRPFGEVYSTTAGAYFFRNTCMKCHGPRGDGDSSLARGILNWSGGSVRVANLIDGMFGKERENLKTFDVEGGRNLGGNYLIWMAMEGTRVRFPPEVSSYMGKHGGQMLNGIREKCLAQISSDKPSSPLFMDHEIFNRVCFMENLEPGHPDLKFDPRTNKPLHPDRVEQWLDHGAWNAGWAIFDFLNEAAVGKWLPSNDQCEQKFGAEGS